MYVCMYVGVYVGVYIRKEGCIYERGCICMYECMHVCKVVTNT